MHTLKETWEKDFIKRKSQVLMKSEGLNIKVTCPVLKGHLRSLK